MGSTTTTTINAAAAIANNISSTTSNVFVYGSLLAEDVVRVLLGRLPYSSPAILPNYHRLSIKGRVYPAIIPLEGNKVYGKFTWPEYRVVNRIDGDLIASRAENIEPVPVFISLFGDNIGENFMRSPERGSLEKVLLGITPPELHILDLFEDEEYERTAIHVVLKDSSEKLQAHTYVWANKADPNLYGEWDFEEWKPLHMKSFLNMTKGFMEEIQITKLKTRIALYESFYQEKDDNLSNT